MVCTAGGMERLTGAWAVPSEFLADHWHQVALRKRGGAWRRRRCLTLVGHIGAAGRCVLSMTRPRIKNFGQELATAVAFMDQSGSRG